MHVVERKMALYFQQIYRNSMMSRIGVGLVRQSQVSLLRFQRKFDPVLSRTEKTQAQLKELKSNYAVHSGYQSEYKLPLNMLEILQIIQELRPQFKISKRNFLNALSPLSMFLFPVGSYVEFPIFFRRLVSENSLYKVVKERVLGAQKEDGYSFYGAFQQAKQFLQEKGFIQIHWNGFEYVPPDGFLDDRPNWFSVEAIALTPKAEALLEYA
jgi:hypothetical protein